MKFDDFFCRSTDIAVSLGMGNARHRFIENGNFYPEG